MRVVFQFSISEVERETGISRDTLRVWERRYGFPAPQRNQRGERLYSSEQLDRLRLLKQLLDRGMRPGRVISLDLDGLRKVTAVRDVSPALCADIEELAALLSAGPSGAFRLRLEELLQHHGLRSFLTEIIAPMNRVVGEAWFTGRTGIVEEHYYAEQLQRVLAREMGNLSRKEGGPRVLLTTFPGEEHGIGLLMVACMLSLEGADPFLLGVQTPLKEIVRGAVENRCSIVGLSCSEHMGRRTIASQLLKLRKLLPEDITLWAGGDGAGEIGFLPGNIRLFTDLRQIPFAITINEY
jgi:DNA-binding transcriptional MerR regulator/methylmalonyl-CoA mutase cobalamin-binding subunit